MEWTRSDTLALALNTCVHCHGIGLKSGRGRSLPCNCVLRGIFRACHEHFLYSATKDKHISKASFDFSRGSERRWSWGRKEEEFVADFWLVTKRSLNETDFRIFRYHFLLGADWKLCCRRFSIDKPRFFQKIYAIEQRLGRVYRELRPYPLYPLDEYYNGTRRLHTPPRLMAMPPASAGLGRPGALAQIA